MLVYKLLDCPDIVDSHFVRLIVIFNVFNVSHFWDIVNSFILLGAIAGGISAVIRKQTGIDFSGRGEVGFSSVHFEHAARGVGLALLAFHAKKGRDIRNLRWNQNPSFSQKRVISRSEISDGIGSLPDFFEIMFRGYWEDRLLVPDEEMEAIKTLLLVARLGKCPIIKNMAAPRGMWVEVGKEKFNDPTNRDVYTQALGKMELSACLNGVYSLSVKTLSKNLV